MWKIPAIHGSTYAALQERSRLPRFLRKTPTLLPLPLMARSLRTLLVGFCLRTPGLEIKNDKGTVPFAQAFVKEIAEILVKAPADTSIRDQSGETVSDRATYGWGDTSFLTAKGDHPIDHDFI